MYFQAILVLATVTAQAAAEDQPEHFDWGGHATVVFRCDFAHYPPKANVDVSCTGCDYDITFDRHPHLCFTTPETSRFAMKFRLPEIPKAAFLNVEHLASADERMGKCVSPVSITINGKPLVQDWNVGQGTYCESEWSRVRHA